MNHVAKGMAAAAIALAGVSAAEAQDAASRGAGTSQQQMIRDFGVSEQQIDALRMRRFNESEIRQILSIAHTMPGGINERNTHRVADLRQNQKLEWPAITEQVGVGPQGLDIPAAVPEAGTDAQSPVENITTPPANTEM